MHGMVRVMAWQGDGVGEGDGMGKGDGVEGVHGQVMVWVSDGMARVMCVRVMAWQGLWCGEGDGWARVMCGEGDGMGKGDGVVR